MSVREGWKDYEKRCGHKIYEVSVNVTKVVDWFKNRKKKQESEYEWCYEHTNFVCKEPADRNVPYCPRCGGNLVYKVKKEA